jgi:hypothetical protein
MTASAMCALAVVSRAGFYHGQHVEKAVDGDLKLRDAIQRIALEFPSYGRPRITAELHRRGWEVNHKRVYRLPILLLRRQTAGKVAYLAPKFRQGRACDSGPDHNRINNKMK